MKKTIYDVAKAAGVSITTVSRVINNTGRISVKTRQKVMAVIMTPDISNPFFGELAKSIEDRADELGFNIIICSTHHDSKKESKYFSILKQKSVDGIIFATGIENHDSMSALKDIVNDDIPLAMISQDKPLVPMDIVIIDYR